MLNAALADNIAVDGAPLTAVGGCAATAVSAGDSASLAADSNTGALLEAERRGPAAPAVSDTATALEMGADTALVATVAVDSCDPLSAVEVESAVASPTGAVVALVTPNCSLAAPVVERCGAFGSMLTVNAGFVNCFEASVDHLAAPGEALACVVSGVANEGVKPLALRDPNTAAGFTPIRWRAVTIPSPPLEVSRPAQQLLAPQKSQEGTLQALKRRKTGIQSAQIAVGPQTLRPVCQPALVQCSLSERGTRTYSSLPGLRSAA